MLVTVGRIGCMSDHDTEILRMADSYCFSMIGKSRSVRQIRPQRFWYKVKREHITAQDGDTILCHTNLTQDVWVDSAYRLACINAPEKEGATLKDGEASMRFLDKAIKDHPYVWIRTLQNKSEKQKKTFNRYIAFVFDPYGACINDFMVESGMATPYMIEILDGGDDFLVK